MWGLDPGILFEDICSAMWVTGATPMSTLTVWVEGGRIIISLGVFSSGCQMGDFVTSILCFILQMSFTAGRKSV